MGWVKGVGTGLAGAAMLTVAAWPAMADPRHERGRERHHHHGDKDDDDAVGGFILGALLAGGLALAFGGKKKQQAEPLPQDIAFVPIASESSAPPAPQADEEAAVAACVASVEHQARSFFAIAQVAGVRTVEAQGAGLLIKGDVTVRQTYREQGEAHPFRCSADGDAVKEVAIDGLQLASR